MTLNKDKCVVIAGGGTGGHLFPAIALGEEITKIKTNLKIHYIGSIYGIEKNVLPKRNLTHTLLPITGLQRNLSFTSAYKNFLLPFRIIKSKNEIKKLFQSINPGLIIGTGGYASAIPLNEGVKRSIPIVIQEQNAFPGITTRMFSSKAAKTFIAFKEAQKFINSKCILRGNPIRESINNGSREDGLKSFDLNTEKLTLLIFGGSQGSYFINSIVKMAINELKKLNIQIIWQTGPLHYNDFSNYECETVKVVPFIENMADAYAVSDLVIARSGAITCSELTYCGKPSILFPFKAAAGDHQSKNAMALSRKGAALVLDEKKNNKNDLIDAISNIILSNETLKKMKSSSLSMSSPNSAYKIAEEALSVMQNV